MAFRKYAKKVIKKGGRYAKKRYFKGKGYSNPKIQTMARDVMRLKGMINAEKQNAETAVSSEYDLAQFNGVASPGLRQFNILPTISQSLSEDGRKGDSLKIVSWCLKVQAYTNGGDTFNGCNYRIYVLREPNNPHDLADIASTFLEPNSFSGIIDYHSNRDYENFKDYVVMGVINGKFKAPENLAQAGNKQNVHTLARKQSFHVRYQKGTNTVLQNQIRLLAVASDGDRSGTNKIFFKYSMKVYYYDN